MAYSKVQKLEAAFTAQMQTLLATEQKTAQTFNPAPSADNRKTAAQVEEAKGSRKENSDVIVQIIVATAHRMITCRAQMLVFSCPDQFSRNSYVDDIGCSISEKHAFFYSARCLRIKPFTCMHVKE
jgi:hypothetical protein